MTSEHESDLATQWRYAKIGMLLSAVIVLGWAAYVRMAHGERIMPSNLIPTFILSITFGMLVGGMFGKVLSWCRSRAS